MAEKYLIDTNIIIYYFNDKIPSVNSNLINKIFSESFNIPIITKIEFLGWRKFSRIQLKQAQEFLSNSEIYNLTNKITDKTIDIRQNYKIQLPDAVIAATCLINDFVLVSHNKNDFTELKDIKIFNPFDKF